MRFEERTVIMRDGRICVLRPAVPENAEELIRFMRITSETNARSVTGAHLPSPCTGNTGGRASAEP